MSSNNDTLIRVTDTDCRMVLKVLVSYCVDDDGGERSEVSNLILYGDGIDDCRGICRVAACIDWTDTVIRRALLPETWIRVGSRDSVQVYSGGHGTS